MWSLFLLLLPLLLLLIFLQTRMLAQCSRILALIVSICLEYVLYKQTLLNFFRFSICSNVHAFVYVFVHCFHTNECFHECACKHITSISFMVYLARKEKLIHSLPFIFHWHASILREYKYCEALCTCVHLRVYARLYGCVCMEQAKMNEWMDKRNRSMFGVYIWANSKLESYYFMKSWVCVCEPFIDEGDVYTHVTMHVNLIRSNSFCRLSCHSYHTQTYYIHFHQSPMILPHLFIKRL